MNIINTIKNAQSFPKLCVALGNFDGVHLGHQQLIKAVVEKAKAIKGTPAVLTFCPHPAKVLTPDNAAKSLIKDSRKINLLQENGIKIIIQVPFTKEFAEISAEDFIEDIVLESDIAQIVAGFNYNFGRGGAGDWKLLKQLSERYKYCVKIIPPVRINGQLVSSTAIRNALSNGEIDLATKLLGRSPIIEGEVTTGNKLGRKLGYPTANINIEENILLPQLGVYLATVIIDNKSYFGLLNIGFRPTLTETIHPVAEVYILDLNQDIYGQYLEVYLLERLRGEIKFDNPDQLKAQIKADILAAQNIIKVKYKKNCNNSML